MNTRIVLGGLPYLNVKPLIRSIERDRPPDYRLIYATPSELARRLRERTCDIAAVSCFEALVNPDLVIVPGVGIGSDGPVESVMVFSNKPFESIRKLALDTSSLSGAALSQIALAELYGCRPELIHHGPDPSEMLGMADACLLIGNPAMTRAPATPHVLDLGEAWKRLTGLPFVFGLWAGLKSSVTAQDVRILQEARRIGMTEVDEIAREQSEAMGLPFERVYNYLTRTMNYDLGDRELAGAAEFGRRIGQMNLAPDRATPEVRVFG